MSSPKPCGTTGRFASSPPCRRSLTTLELGQEATSVAFDDESVADFFDSQVDAGRQPQEFGRIWVHTHPGNCPRPSLLDEQTFARVFGSSEWAVMFILAQGGQTYARLQMHVGPGAVCRLPVEIDFLPPFLATDSIAWEAEYLAHVTSYERFRRDELQPAKMLPAAQASSAQVAMEPEHRPALSVFDDRRQNALPDWPDEWRDPFFGGDDPPFDFELQRIYDDARF